MTACPNRSSATLLPPGFRTALAAFWSPEGSFRRRVPKGGFLFAPGEPADPLFLIEEGAVKLSVSSRAGRDLTVGLFGPGDVFGEEAILEDATRVAFAVALEPTVLATLPRRRLHQLLDRDRDTALFFARLLAARLREATRRAEEIALSPVPARLARALLRLAGPSAGGAAGAPASGVRITHQELANLIGSTRETTTATLNAFRRRGWIALAHRRILLLRPDALAGEGSA